MNETQEKKEFEADPAKKQELRDLAYKFIDKIKSMGGEGFEKSEGFNGKDGGDIDFLNSYQKEGDQGVIEHMKYILDGAMDNPGYKGTIFEGGARNEELAKSIFREATAEIKQDAGDAKKLSLGNLKKKIFRGK